MEDIRQSSGPGVLRKIEGKAIGGGETKLRIAQ